MVKKLALIVGIDKYPELPLDCCVYDAMEIAETLKDGKYGFEVIELYDNDATRRNIKYELVECIERDCDAFLFYFSGHGLKTDYGTFLCGIDTDEYDEGVEFDYIKRCVCSEKAANKSIVLIFDCCHSGGVGIMSGITPRNYISNENIKNALEVLGAGRVVLAACKEDQSSYEDDNSGHGFYTGHLLDGLKGDAADGEGDITAPGLHNYVCSKLRNMEDQIPVFSGDIAGKFVLGQGFSPKNIVGLTEQEFLDIEAEAARHLDEYQGKMNISSRRSQWTTYGYKTACQLLEPLARWFTRQISDHSDLLAREKFYSLYESLINRKAILGSLDIGTNLAKGEVVKILGTGTFGTVYQVKDQGSARTYAYKVFHAQDIRIVDKVKRFERGYHAMRQLDHSHIVKVFEYSECPIGFYMEYIEGPNLRDFGHEILSINEKLVLLLIVSDTLAHAHMRDVYHRDVKPENIILKYNANEEIWQPFLTDFDLAWFSTATKVTKEGMGTLYYASPEQLGKPSSRLAKMPTTDVFSFGQLCFFLFTGRDPVPFDQMQNIDIISRVVQTQMHLESATMFIDFYKKTTDVIPEKRYQDFPSISGVLYNIRQSFANVSPSAVLSFDEFVDELAFSIVGLAPGKRKSPSSFESLTGRFAIALYRRDVAKGVSIEACLEANDRSFVQGCTYADVCKVHNKNVESILSGYRFASWSKGRSTPYSVNITFDLNDFSYANVQLLRTIFVGLISSLERD
ncbi:MAG: caspase family protein [Desulfovibrionaceae bacterium]